MLNETQVDRQLTTAEYRHHDVMSDMMNNIKFQIIF